MSTALVPSSVWCLDASTCEPAQSWHPTLSIFDGARHHVFLSMLPAMLFYTRDPALNPSLPLMLLRHKPTPAPCCCLVMPSKLIKVCGTVSFTTDHQQHTIPICCGQYDSKAAEPMRQPEDVDDNKVTTPLSSRAKLTFSEGYIAPHPGLKSPSLNMATAVPIDVCHVRANPVRADVTIANVVLVLGLCCC